jgi:hypothetical protein
LLHEEVSTRRLDVCTDRATDRLAAAAAATTWRIRHGRSARLAIWLLAAVTAIGWQPASTTIITGALISLLLTRPGRPDRPDLSWPPHPVAMASRPRPLLAQPAFQFAAVRLGCPRQRFSER